ncbi:MAG: acetylglutamate kinase [Candidatus Nanopelagicaceae bacterium]|nr:acetylglutamate kinase [Candidatus Nanopelagicaceae bacterium]
MIVIKFGGHAMGDNASQWMNELVERFKGGERFVVVHGGGPQIDKELKLRNIQKKMINGFRYTDQETMQVVEMVLTGTVLRSVVRSLIRVGLPAVGITGSDSGLLQVDYKDKETLGLVGVVKKVNPKLLHDLLDMGYLPVIAPVANDLEGTALNVNADLAAGAIAGALRATQMLFLTDVPGIYANWPEQSSLIESITVQELKRIDFTEGMIPKVEAAINAIESGALSSRVIDGNSIESFVSALNGEGGTWVHA